MTWTQRVGDFAANVALLLINLGRIVTLLLRVLADKLDRFVTNLAQRSEGGIGRVGTQARSWVSLPAAVAFGAAAIALRALSVATVFARQITETADEFLRALAEDVTEPTPPEPSDEGQPVPAGGSE